MNLIYPRFTKYKKTRKKNTLSKNITKGPASSCLRYGDFGVQSREAGRLTADQIEATRRVLARSKGKNSYIFVHCFPDQPVTEKAKGVRIGKGKGKPAYWVSTVYPGQLLFERKNVPTAKAKAALRACCKKRPFKADIVIRNDLLNKS